MIIILKTNSLVFKDVWLEVFSVNCFGGKETIEITFSYNNLI